MTPETQHLLTVLRSVIRVLGYTYTDIARKMGVGSGYLSRLFAGKIELKVDHVVDIAKAIGLEPQEILELAWPEPKRPPSLAAARYNELVTGAEHARRPVPWSLESSPAEGDMEAALAKALQRLLTPAAPPRAVPSVATEEDVEKIVERMLRKFFGNLAQVKGE